MVRDHSFHRHRADVLARLPVAETWPCVLRAYAEGAIRLSFVYGWTPERQAS
jgi:hypothetical protein